MVNRSLVAMAILFAVLQVFLTSHVHKISWVVLPMFATGITAAARAAVALVGPSATRRVAICFVAISVSVAVIEAHAQRANVEGDASRPNLTAQFTTPKLAGIYSTPQRVAAIDEVTRYLRDRIEPGAYFLAYDHMALFYYLTDTRPSVDTVWVTKKSPLWIRQNSMSYMKAQQRFPEYCLRSDRSGFSGLFGNMMKLRKYSDNPDRDPVNGFVIRNYELVRSVPPFDIFIRKSSALPAKR